MSESSDRLLAAFVKYDRSESAFKVLVSKALGDADIRGWNFEQRIYTFKSYLGSKACLLGDIFTAPEKKWIIECKIKADVSSCAKALGQCILYRELGGFEHAIICLPSKAYHFVDHMEEFERVCKAVNVDVATENTIVRTIKNYENPTNTNTELRTNHDASLVVA